MDFFLHVIDAVGVWCCGGLGARAVPQVGETGVATFAAPQRSLRDALARIAACSAFPIFRSRVIRCSRTRPWRALKPWTYGWDRHYSRTNIRMGLAGFI